jgi:hypothetical protein
MQQVISPNPNIPCQPGWCLAYVNEAFGVPKRYGSATAAWEASTTQHRDYDVPYGCWVPVWFALANEPAGHVALLAPDGAVYSTSDLGSTPHHHPSLGDLGAYYAYYGMPLTYRGWTEDVEGTPVVASSSAGTISVQGDVTSISTSTESEEDAMASAEWLATVIQAIARTETKVNNISDRIFGRDVQRYYRPDTLEVRTEPFTGSIPARTTDVHDIISTNNLIVSQSNKILDAVSKVPGVDASVVAGLRQELTDELQAALSGLSVTLVTEPRKES